MAKGESGINRDEVMHHTNIGQQSTVWTTSEELTSSFFLTRPACLLTSVWPHTYCVSVGVNGLPPTVCAWSQFGVAIKFFESLSATASHPENSLHKTTITQVAAGNNVRRAAGAWEQRRSVLVFLLQ